MSGRQPARRDGDDGALGRGGAERRGPVDPDRFAAPGGDHPGGDVDGDPPGGVGLHLYFFVVREVGWGLKKKRAPASHVRRRWSVGPLRSNHEEKRFPSSPSLLLQASLPPSCPLDHKYLEREMALGIGIVQVEPAALLAGSSWRCSASASAGRREFGAEKGEPLREHGEARGGRGARRGLGKVRRHGWAACDRAQRKKMRNIRCRVKTKQKRELLCIDLRRGFFFFFDLLSSLAASLFCLLSLAPSLSPP